MFRMEIDGVEPDLELTRTTLISQYGHFTALQVRAGRTQGLDLHLARLAAASKELFAADLDPDLVRAHIRHALRDDVADASVRVMVLNPADPAATPPIVVTVRPPFTTPAAPQRLRSVPYLRPLAHIKQVGGSFGQIYHGTAAEHDGFDDALLTGPDGLIAETTIANIGFFDGTTITWPAAPQLEGTAKQLLNRHAPTHDLPHTHRAIRLADAPAYQAAFVANSQGIAPVAAIDDHEYAPDAAFMARLHQVYDAAPWDEL